MTETVTVASEAQLLQTDKADVSTELKSAEITAMPLNRFRNYQALMNLVPGTTPMAFGNAETDTPARSLATNVNGQANTNNSTRTDGATNMNIWLPNHNMYISPAETIDTVNISTSSFDAEQGMAGGAAVTVVTKSGTNQFKGSGFEFYNSDKLNATPYFFGAARCRSKLPVEGSTPTAARSAARSRRTACSSSDRSKATSATRACSRSSACRTPRCAPATSARRAVSTQRHQQLIYDPATGEGERRRPARSSPTTRFPPSRIDPIALKIMNLFPLPNVAGHRRRRPDEQLSALRKTRTVDRKNYDVKLNWNRTDRAPDLGQVQLHERGGRRPDQLPRSGSECRRRRRVHQGVPGHGRPDLDDVADNADGHDVRVRAPEASRSTARTSTPATTASTCSASPGTNDQGIGDQRYAGYPAVQHRLQRGRQPRRLEPDLPRRADLLAGHEPDEAEGTPRPARRLLRELHVPGSLAAGNRQPARALRRSTATSTGLNGGQTTNFYNQYASFLLGLVGNVNKSVQNELMTVREWQHALYFRDRWNVYPKLTLDLGLRWEFYPIMKRAEGRGLDRLDLTNPDSGEEARRPHRRQRRQPADQRDGSRPGQLRAPGRRRLPPQREDGRSAPATVSRYNATPWARAVRGDNDYPVTIASSVLQPRPVRVLQHARAGDPDDCRTRPEHGSRAAGSLGRRVHAGDRQRRSRLHPDVERRVRAAPAVRHVGGRRLRRGQGDRRIRRARHQRTQTLGGGDASRPFASQRPPHRHQLVGAASEDELQLAAGRAQQALHARAAVQGRLHAQQVDERERQRRPGHADAGIRPASSAATRRPRASTAGTTSSSDSPMPCRGRARTGTTTS